MLLNCMSWHRRASRIKIYFCENGGHEQAGKTLFFRFLKKSRKFDVETGFLGKMTLTGFLWLGI